MNLCILGLISRHSLLTNRNAVLLALRRKFEVKKVRYTFKATKTFLWLDLTLAIIGIIRY